jgi:hypothetical protein
MKKKKIPMKTTGNINNIHNKLIFNLEKTINNDNDNVTETIKDVINIFLIKSSLD